MKTNKTKSHFVKAKTPENRKKQQAAIINYYAEKRDKAKKEDNIKIVVIKKESRY